MGSLIKYKFVNAKDNDTILFEGTSIPLESLKRAIMEKHNIVSGADLVIMDINMNGK